MNAKNGLYRFKDSINHSLASTIYDPFVISILKEEIKINFFPVIIRNSIFSRARRGEKKEMISKQIYE